MPTYNKRLISEEDLKLVDHVVDVPVHGADLEEACLALINEAVRKVGPFKGLIKTQKPVINGFALSKLLVEKRQKYFLRHLEELGTPGCIKAHRTVTRALEVLARHQHQLPSYTRTSWAAQLAREVPELGEDWMQHLEFRAFLTRLGVEEKYHGTVLAHQVTRDDGKTSGSMHEARWLCKALNPISSPFCVYDLVAGLLVLFRARKSDHQTQLAVVQHATRELRMGRPLNPRDLSLCAESWGDAEGDDEALELVERALRGSPLPATVSFLPATHEQELTDYVKHKTSRAQAEGKRFEAVFDPKSRNERGVVTMLKHVLA